MSGQILPGDGWRLLGPEEVVREGDEAWDLTGQKWGMPKFTLGLKASLFHAVRRRIPAKPEAMEIEAARGRLRLEIGTTGNAWIGQDLGAYVEEVKFDTPEQIRQVIAWLQQVADWREAQDSK